MQGGEPGTPKAPPHAQETSPGEGFVPTPSEGACPDERGAPSEKEARRLVAPRLPEHKARDYSPKEAEDMLVGLLRAKEVLDPDEDAKAIAVIDAELDRLGKVRVSPVTDAVTVTRTLLDAARHMDFGGARLSVLAVNPPVYRGTETPDAVSGDLHLANGQGFHMTLAEIVSRNTPLPKVPPPANAVSPLEPSPGVYDFEIDAEPAVPSPDQPEQGEEMLVYKINDHDWVAARSVSEALAGYQEATGVTDEELIGHDPELPRALSAEEMEREVYVDREGEFGEEGGKLSFATAFEEKLSRRTPDAGAFLFASTEH